LQNFTFPPDVYARAVRERHIPLPLGDRVLACEAPIGICTRAGVTIARRTPTCGTSKCV